MQPSKLVLSPEAQRDLRDIYQFGLCTWGQNQSSDYLDALKEHFWHLTTQPFMGTERPELGADMRSFPVKSHIVFYRLQANQIEIVRILHGRQDPNRHIK